MEYLDYDCKLCSYMPLIVTAAILLLMLWFRPRKPPE